MTAVVAFGEIGYLVYKRTYARPLGSKGEKSEEFSDTVERVVRACQDQLQVGFSAEERDFLRNMIVNMKGLVAGRFLWQLGTATVDKLGLASLQNCASTPVNHPIRPFTWAMDMLMLGAGVGYNIQKEYVYELPRVRKVSITRRDSVDADFIVPDTREGWVSLLERVLSAHFISGKSFAFSTHCIRSKGAPIRGFGGVASGPEELAWGMAEISKVLNGRAGKKVRPVDCLDIMNIIGYVVVAGNVRRSAQIALGDCDDLAYLSAKRWDLGMVPKWRAMSNNSVVCADPAHLPQQFWDGYNGLGEPYGLANLKAAREYGRAGEQRLDPSVTGLNPCAEITLSDFETCCLGEIVLPNVKGKHELFQVAEILYRICKHSLRLPCHHPETEEIVHKNMRIGLGVTGYLQATEEQRSWLSECYDHLRWFDRTYSMARGWPESIRLTTVKPSGTLSLLAGVTPGCHPAYSQYYIRRVRIASNSPLLEVIRSHGYPIEPALNLDGTIDHNTVVASFPCSVPANTRLAKDMSALDQLEVVRRLQREWSDNAVSCTVYYRKEELPAIKEWLAKNWQQGVKSLSFLLHSDHGFLQAPLEEITKEQYDTMKVGCQVIDSCSVTEDSLQLDTECVSGACPVK